MNALFLITTLVCMTFKSVCSKIYTNQVKGGTYTYSVLAGIGTVIFFLVTAKDLTWDLRIVPYAVVFGVSYVTAGIFGLKAIAVGSLSLTSLVISCSLVLPTFYGLIFLNEAGGVPLYAGIILLIVALVLVNKTSVTTPITGKWIFYVSISFIANGMCSISQNAQQKALDGAGKNELMILALIIVILASSVLAFIRERDQIKLYVQKGLTTGLLGGAANGVVNLMVMFLVGRLPASVVFPMISGGSIVLTYIVSRVFYKEKLSGRQTAGFLLGIISIVLLNL